MRRSVLKSNLRDGDFVARVGGDEFVVLCKADGSRTSAPGTSSSPSSPTASSNEMHQPVLYEGHECRFGVSIGIASDLDAVADPQPAAGQRRSRALPGQEPRPQPLPVLQRCAAGRDRHHQAHRRRHPVRPGAQRVRRLLPAAVRRRDARHHRRRGAGALEPSDRGPAGAGGLHEDRRGAERRRDDRPDDPRADLEELQRLGGRRAAACRRPRSTSRRAGCTTRN